MKDKGVWSLKEWVVILMTWIDFLKDHRMESEGLILLTGEPGTNSHSLSLRVGQVRTEMRYCGESMEHRHLLCVIEPEGDRF